MTFADISGRSSCVVIEVMSDECRVMSDESVGGDSALSTHHSLLGSWHFARLAGRPFRREMVLAVDDEEHAVPPRVGEESPDDAPKLLDPFDGWRLGRRRIAFER